MIRNKATRPAWEELKALREDRGWNQALLAVVADLPRSTVSRWESNQRARGLILNTRALGTMRKFESAFDVEEGYFLEEQLYVALLELRELVDRGYIRLPQLQFLIDLAQRQQADEDEQDGQ